MEKINDGQKLKMFIVSKIVMAKNCEDAIKLEKYEKPISVYLDEDWKKNNL